MTFKCLCLFFQNKMGSDYDLERVIDDWILMGFLVGNDFIPHLPNLHINHDALPLLYKTYMSVLPSLGGKTRLVSCVFPQFLVSSFSLVFNVISVGTKHFNSVLNVLKCLAYLIP